MLMNSFSIALNCIMEEEAILFLYRNNQEFLEFRHIHKSIQGLTKTCKISRIRTPNYPLKSGIIWMKIVLQFKPYLKPQTASTNRLGWSMESLRVDSFDSSKRIPATHKRLQVGLWCSTKSRTLTLLMYSNRTYVDPQRDINQIILVV